MQRKTESYCKYKDVLESLVSAVNNFNKAEQGNMIPEIAKKELNVVMARAKSLLQRP